MSHKLSVAVDMVSYRPIDIFVLLWFGKYVVNIPDKETRSNRHDIARIALDSKNCFSREDKFKMSVPKEIFRLADELKLIQILVTFF